MLPRHTQFGAREGKVQKLKCKKELGLFTYAANVFSPPAPPIECLGASNVGIGHPGSLVWCIRERFFVEFRSVQRIANKATFL